MRAFWFYLQRGIWSNSATTTIKEEPRMRRIALSCSPQRQNQVSMLPWMLHPSHITYRPGIVSSLSHPPRYPTTKKYKRQWTIPKNRLKRIIQKF